MRSWRSSLGSTTRWPCWARRWAKRHIRLLRRFADPIALVLDGDEAGQRRANEVLGLFVAEQVDLRIVTLPEGLDPADFLLQRGAEAFRAIPGRRGRCAGAQAARH